MEDPIRFDVWAIIKGDLRQEAVDHLRNARPLLSMLEIRKEINKSVIQNQEIQIASSLTWPQVEIFRSQPEEWIATPSVFQEGYGPIDSHRLSLCSKHNLYFGGCLGCPVCKGFYAS